MDQILSKSYSIRKRESETMSSFNRRFARLYYSMSKEVQPLEGVTKLIYVSIFPPNLYLFVLERKSGSLEKIFADALEVEENFRLSRRILDHGRNNERDKELNLTDLNETKEEFPWKLAPLSSRQKEYQCDGEEVAGFSSSFPKYCD